MAEKNWKDKQTSMFAESVIALSRLKRAPKSQLRWPLVALVLAIAAVVFLWSNTAYDIDDAPITYRYADNIVEGNGFVYNRGERVLGTSTPLYTLLLATLGVLGIATPTASNVLNLLGSVALVATTMALAWRLKPSFWTTLLAGILLLIQGSFLRLSMAGMETPVYTLLVVSTLLAFAHDRTLLSAVLAGLASLMRLDGLVVVGAILLGAWIRQRRLPWREIAVVALVLAPWVLFSTLYFGSPIPLSMLAKQQHLQAAQYNRFWIWEWLFLKPLLEGQFLLPFVLAGLIWSVYKRSTFATQLALATWLGAYLIAYTVVGIPFYEWYLVPAYPVLVIFAVIGLAATYEAMRKLIPSRRLVVPMMSIALLAILLRPYARQAYASVEGYKRYLLALEGTRASAGEWLRDFSDPQDRIRAGAIGHIGYTSGNYIIDSAGLITPPELLAELKPDYFVLFYPNSSQRCGPVKDYDTGWASHPRVTISRCSEAKGEFGRLILSEARVTNWVLYPDDTWHRESETFLETQWLVQERAPERDWTLYVHFTNTDGDIVAQADHLLGSQAVGPALPTTQWPTDKRIYDYVPLPAEIPEAASPVQIRVGVWDPETGDYVAAVTVDSHTDEHGRLVIGLP